MPSLPLTWLDVFAAAPLAGNQLAVVHDADGLTEDTMLAFARETGLSETTFVQTPTEGVAATYRTRIFDEKGELPFAGHPSLGTAVAVAARLRERQAAYIQETRAGLQPVGVGFSAERAARASMLQEPAVTGPGLDAAEVLAACGLPSACADARLPVCVVSTGLPWILAAVSDPDRLAQARGGDELRALAASAGADGVYLASVDDVAEEARTRALFVGRSGVIDDPATGSAAGALMAHAAAHLGVGRLSVAQGDHIGRPSRIECALEGERVSIAGEVAIVAEGTVHLPD